MSNYEINLALFIIANVLEDGRTKSVKECEGRIACSAAV